MWLFQLSRETLGEAGYAMLGGSRHAVWFAIVGGLVTLHFLGFFAIQRQVGAWLAPVAGLVRLLSGCTLTIYLLHWPLLLLAATIVHPAPIDPVKNIGLLVFALVVSIAIGRLIEPRRHALRSVLVDLATSARRATKAPVALVHAPLSPPSPR